jgi:Na+-driven multidrug efflux pump
MLDYWVQKPGLALGFQMMMLVMMLSAGSFGGTITGAVARLLGAGNRQGAEVLAHHAVLMMLLLAGLCSAIFLLGGHGIYSLLGGRRMVIEQAHCGLLPVPEIGRSKA